jgi:hypothetical protein
MASAAYQVFPLVPSALVEHTVKLMRTDQPFLQDAGVSRLHWLSRFELARQKALELGALDVLNVLERAGVQEERRKALVERLMTEQGAGLRGTPPNGSGNE